MHRFTVFCLAFVTALQCAISAADENWSQWRGPLGTGVAGAGDYPIEFSGTEGVAWKAKLPGVGTSTPAVWGDRIIVTCGIKGEGGKTHDGVVCFDMNGKELWRRPVWAGPGGEKTPGLGREPSPGTPGGVTG